MLRKQRKKGTIVVDHVVLYRCFTVVSWVMWYCTAVLLMQVEVMRYCTAVLLMQVEVMYSGPVVIMF